ncbi:hypothetical protein, partial [Burkholderia ubonensis]|uniref:hypothetical protein n=1 Tax=Burkholderia ubonensis TaxID=101571 RepID=UPI002FC61C0B
MMWRPIGAAWAPLAATPLRCAGRIVESRVFVVYRLSGAQAVTGHRRGACLHRDGAQSHKLLSETAQPRSTASATPIPPPMHSDASPRFASRLT